MNNPSKFPERCALLEAIAADPELPASALKLAMTLMAFVNGPTGLCCPAQVTIRDRCHLSRNTIDTATQALERRGWLWVERDYGGDRDSNRYYFEFDRVRKGGDHYGFTLRDGWKDRKGRGTETVAEAELEEAGFHGSKIEPCSAVHGSNSEPSMAQNLTKHGSKIEPELQEVNSKNGTQESLAFGEGNPINGKQADIRQWAEKVWWPQYPLKVEKRAAINHIVRIVLKGEATQDELMDGTMRYAASDTVRRGFIKHPTTWLNRGCWTDEPRQSSGRSDSAVSRGVWGAVDRAASRGKRAIG